MALRALGDITGRSVLVLGATGSSGSMAVRIARHLGAARVIAAGRDESRLAELSGIADAIVPLGDPDRAATALAEASDVDIVLDYLWGPVTEMALGAILRARADDTQLLDGVQIGGMAGPGITLPAGALRSKALRLSGSGFGSTPFEVYRREIPDAAKAIVDGVTVIRPVTFPLREVETAWTHDVRAGERTVILL